MAGYKAGNLELSLTAINKDAIQSIDDVAKSLSSLSTALRGITVERIKGFRRFATTLNAVSTATKTVEINKLTSSIDGIITVATKLATSLSGITPEQAKVISSIGTAFSGLSKISGIDEKFDKMDFNKVADGFKKLTTAITPFIDKINSAQTGLTAMYGVLQKVSGKKFGKIISSANGGGKSGGSFGSLFNFGKLAGAYYLMRRIGGAVANIVQYGTNFTETLNLWQVAMRENLDQADEFIKKMNRAYSISQQTLMNAQATFKNMIGSLGNISDAVSYQLSESILQMALDFSSLYNTTFESAIQKFQAVLAGQVRPIRSVSGYDITETTLYQVYQSLGGTKTQRQLNRTEKQLLAIYAVFQQMQRSGAVGDLSKTLDNFANQSRMMTENFKELKTYVGLFFQDLLQSWGVLKYINAGLIFSTELVKALTKYEAPNFIEGMFESTVAENEALDELQGKLLDFDKFRALDSTSATSDLAIDQSILNAVSDYQSILENVNNSARELATKWLKDIGLFTVNENGELVISDKKLKDIKSTIEGILIAVGSIFAYNLGASIASLIKKIVKLTGSMSLLNSVLVGGIIFSFIKMIKSFEDGNTAAGILATVGLAVCITAFGLLNAKMLATMKINIINFFSKVSQSLQFLTKSVNGLNIAFSGTLGILSFMVFDGLLNSIGEDARKVVSPILAAVGAVAALTAAFMAMQGVLTWGTALPVLLASVGAAVAGVKAMIDPKMFAIGASDIDGGTLFVAGEAGKTEAVYTGSNGKTNVANIQQMKSAFYQALVEYGQTHTDERPIVVYLDGKVAYESTTAYAKQRGQKWAK